MKINFILIGKSREIHYLPFRCIKKQRNMYIYLKRLRQKALILPKETL